jgi:xanthine dehydrogenase large subunit
MRIATHARRACAVLTAADIPGVNNTGPIVHDEPLIPADLVEFFGQAVAWVVAEDDEAVRVPRRAQRCGSSTSRLPARLTTCMRRHRRRRLPLPPAKRRTRRRGTALATAPHRLRRRTA